MEELARLILKIEYSEYPVLGALEGHLMKILLDSCWPAVVAWAEKVVPYKKVCRKCGDTYYAACEDSKLCPKPTCRTMGKRINRHERT